jgi:hypothetical protein
MLARTRCELHVHYNAEPIVIGNRLRNVEAAEAWNAHEWDVQR